MVNRHRWLLMWLAVAPAAWAQREPHIGYVYPAGGRQGTTVAAVIGGQYLNGADQIYVTGPDVQAVVVEHEPSLTPKQAQALRQRLEELRKQPKDAAARQEILAIRKKLAAFAKLRANPAIAETVPVAITIATNAVPGNRELRLGTPLGLSNPLVFQVGQLPEFRQPEPDAAAEPPFPRPGVNPVPAETPPLPITLPATVNGQILPGGVARYRFPARRGQQLVVATSARELIPYLADAVPGWFQAALTLYDPQGEELAYDDHYRFHPDPVLHYVIPQDGAYTLKIRDVLYRGREDFVYRVALGELPFLASLFPLGGRAGTRATVEVRGWNLPVTRLHLSLKQTPPGTYPIAVRNQQWFSNPLPFLVDTLPECREREPNNSPRTAQPVALPIIINGRCDPPGDVDVFRFDGRAGQQIVAEVMARRLESPLDSVLKLTDATGHQLAFNDDHEDKGSGLNTHHADSYLRATLPADGRYYLSLWDAQRNGGWAYSYRLRLSAPRPDFELRVVPASLSVRIGTSAPLTVYALRQDGFTGEIALTLKDAPAGFKLTATPIPANQDQVKLTLTPPPTAPTGRLRLHLEGRAMIEGREIVHAAVPAEDMMQAFAYRHLVPAQEWDVAVIGRFRPAETARILSALPVKIPGGGAARVQVSLPGGPFLNQIAFELTDPPDGVTLQTVSPTEFMLRADATKISPGRKGNLIVQATAARRPPPGAPGRRFTVGALPAIPFEVIQP